MATLELEINCLCLLVRDEKNHAVHVLMPRTPEGSHSHRDPGEEGCHDEKHVVRLLHPTFGGDGTGRPMEGWALELGNPDAPSAETTIPGSLKAPYDEVANISCLAMAGVPRRLVQGRADEVVARISLFGGKATSVKGEAPWELGGRRIFMAHQVVWTIDGVADELKWVNLGASQPAPVEKLSDLGTGGSEDGARYRLQLHHVPLCALPPTEGGALEPDEVMHHFAHFYGVFGISNPPPEWIPVYHEPFGKLHCAAAQAVLAET